MAPAGARTIVFSFLGLGRIYSGWERVRRNLLCSCRPTPAGIHYFCGHPKSANPWFLMFCSNWDILNKILRNSSFTRPYGFIIDSSRSRTFFLTLSDVPGIFFYDKNIILKSWSSCLVAHPVVLGSPRFLGGCATSSSWLKHFCFRFSYRWWWRFPRAIFSKQGGSSAGKLVDLDACKT